MAVVIDLYVGTLNYIAAVQPVGQLTQTIMEKNIMQIIIWGKIHKIGLDVL